MTHRILVLAALMAVSLVATASALAQSPCGNHDQIVKMLDTKYKELRIAAAIMAGRQSMIEIFTSATGTWTILVTTGGGATCIVSAGEGWEAFEKKILGDNL